MFEVASSNVESGGQSQRWGVAVLQLVCPTGEQMACLLGGDVLPVDGVTQKAGEYRVNVSLVDGHPQ